ncbi:hypothetical protein BJY01DRAFT_227628 [Aspergillus pseudoustus]|uniref:C2H2-type domain-containing protein n=1 Tax=Aspergillus pseudoustus TaxID=1810923 RepID=A0ABR4ISP3_9EURO
MSSIINRMKIETLLDPCHQSGLSNNPPGLHLAPSLNAPVLPLSSVEFNRGPFKTPGWSQDVSFRRRLERPGAHGPKQVARPKRPLPRVSNMSYVSRPTAMAKRLQIACPLKRCPKAFSDNRELRKHYTKAHLPSLKEELLVQLDSKRSDEGRKRPIVSTKESPKLSDISLEKIGPL